MLKIAALEKLVHELSHLPGIGPKTAQRLAYYILKSPAEYSQHLTEALQRVQSEVHTCPECFNYTDAVICKYCEDPHRQSDVICVVEEPMDISRIEASGAFRGRFHVLHGAISPLEGVGPQQLKIKELLAKVNKGVAGDGPAIREVIMALDADLEGDTTVLYLTKQLQDKSVRISRIAHGIPIGSDIDYVDDRTMGRALENRVEL
ncbi:MAG: recombination protein RecR [Oligoflexia bacterium]|nr:MAG: recombination protein RecR [Oligoflexia bacterium]